jgi:hypothetical protein
MFPEIAIANDSKSALLFLSVQRSAITSQSSFIQTLDHFNSSNPHTFRQHFRDRRIEFWAE